MNRGDEILFSDNNEQKKPEVNMLSSTPEWATGASMMQAHLSSSGGSTTNRPRFNNNGNINRRRANNSLDHYAADDEGFDDDEDEDDYDSDDNIRERRLGDPYLQARHEEFGVAGGGGGGGVSSTSSSTNNNNGANPTTATTNSSSNDLIEHDVHDWTSDYFLSEQHLFRPVLTLDVDQRREAIESITRLFYQASKVDAINNSSNDNNDNNDEYYSESRLSTGGGTPKHAAQHPGDGLSFSALAQKYLPFIIRFAFESPFDDVRLAFRELHNFLIRMGVAQPVLGSSIVSSFVNPQSLVPVDKVNNEVKQIFQDLFIHHGRIPHYMRLMSWHPVFLSSFYMDVNNLMTGEGSLPLSWRNYIAIMAASRFKCEYLIKFQEAEFLHNGGDPTWLQGIDHIPPKLHSLLQINSLLAHQPWLLRKHHVEPLVKGGLDSWSLAELVHAIVLMCTFHSMAGFIFGCGIMPEHIEAGDYSITSPLSLLQVSPTSADSSERGMSDETFKIVQQMNENPEPEEVPDNAEEKARTFEKAETTETTDPFHQQHASSGMDIGEYSRKYTNNDNLEYVDFDVRSKEYRILTVHEYSWQDHAYELLSRFYNGQPDLLDQEFTNAQTMTDNQFNGIQNVDTKRLRYAVWYYVQRVFGILHDDYNYGEVNRFLNRPLKQYIKKVACFPETVTISDFKNIGYDLRPEEKCHINLLTISARKQAQLVYGLQVIDMLQKQR